MVNWEVEADLASDSVCLQLERTTVQVVGGGILAAQHSLIICRVYGHLQRKIICVLVAEVLAEGQASLLATSSSMHKEFTRETGNLSLPRSAMRHIILFKVLGGVVDLPVGSVPLCSRGTGGRGGAGLDGLERLVVDS